MHKSFICQLKMLKIMSIFQKWNYSWFCQDGSQLLFPCAVHMTGNTNCLLFSNTVLCMLIKQKFQKSQFVPTIKATRQKSSRHWRMFFRRPEKKKLACRPMFQGGCTQTVLQLLLSTRDQPRSWASPRWWCCRTAQCHEAYGCLRW